MTSTLFFGRRPPGDRRLTTKRWGPRMFSPLLITLTAALGLAGSAGAQQDNVVAGVVVDQGQGPVPNAQITIRGTSMGALTDAAGRFRLVSIPSSAGAQVTLDVRRIGFKSAVQTVRVGTTDARIEMTPAAINLNAVVTTGQVGQTEKRTLGVDIAQIDAASVVQQAPVRDVQQLLNGRVAGVTVLQNSGMIGSGATVRVRGLSSFALSNQPLIVVDGVRVDNSQSTGPTNQAFGASTTTRWNDFNPDDIQSIEVVKGSAATTLYGTDAANGVIQIFTKKGSQGRPTWDFTMRQGVNQFANPEGRLWVNYGPDATGAIVPIDQVERRNAQGNPIFQNGHLQSYSLGVGGGSPTVSYRASGSFDRNEGVESNNLLNNYSGRANLTITPSDKVDISANLGYVTGRTDLSLEAGGGGTTWSTYFAQPQKLGTPSDGFYSGTPDAYHKQYQDYQIIGRFTGGFQVNHRPATWFNQRLIVGIDRGFEDSEELAAVHPDLSYFFGTDADSGYKDVMTRDNSQSTFNYTGTAKFGLGRSLTTATSLGADLYFRTTKFVSAHGEDFPAPGLQSLSQTTAARTGSENVVENNTVGAYVQEEFGWRDRMFLTVGVRRDDNSSFGASFNKVYYPKASLAWVLSDEPFFKLPHLTTFKLRAAYGESGQAPPPYSAVPSFTAATGPGGSASVTPQSSGNPDLGPERAYETELGFDAGLFDNRLGVELTYFTGGTRDAILQTQANPSSGYPGTKFVNAGRLTRHGFEVALRATPFQTTRSSLDFGLTIGTNSTKVTQLSSGLQFIPASANVQHRIGYPVGSWFGKKVVGATLDANGNATTVMCDDGSPAHAAVPCGSAPDSIFLGRTVPSFEGAFNSTFRLTSNLSFFGQLDFKGGYKKLDGNRRVRCHLFAECRENYYPKEFSPAIVGAVTSGSFVSDIINDASYTKLRELSVTYTLPASLIARTGASRAALTVAGRNLITWTKYTGLEPEASFQGGSRGFGQWEQDVLPQLRTFVTTITLTF